MRPSPNVQAARGRKAKRARKKAKPGSAVERVVRLVLKLARGATAASRRFLWRVLRVFSLLGGRLARAKGDAMVVVLRAARRQAREGHAQFAAQLTRAAHMAAG